MKYILLILMILVVSLAKGQKPEGFIIKIDGDRVYTNLHRPAVKVSDVLSVFGNRGNGTEVVTQIEITAIPGAYSVGRILGNASMPLAEKMTVRKGDNYQAINSNISTPKITESAPVVQSENYAPPVIQNAPAQVIENVPTPIQAIEMPIVQQNNYSTPLIDNPPIQQETKINFQNNNQQAVNNNGKIPVIIALASESANNLVAGASVGDAGYIGEYAITALTEQLLKCDKIQLLDQSIAQDMGSKARYKIKVVMQKPDVADKVSSGISTGGSNSGYTGEGEDIGVGLKNTQVKISMNIKTQIIDMQTGGIVLVSSATGKASGAPQINVGVPTSIPAFSALQSVIPGGVQLSNIKANINQGATFIQTEIGKAIEDAFKKLGKEINEFFNNH